MYILIESNLFQINHTIHSISFILYHSYSLLIFALEILNIIITKHCVPFSLVGTPTVSISPVAIPAKSIFCGCTPLHHL